MNYIPGKIAVLAVLISLTFFGSAWIARPADDGRNLKVLPKDISSDSLERIMDVFTESLNVGCAYCHAPKDSLNPKKLNYASDANHKKDITRSMMRMTNEINAKYISTIGNNPVQLVSCNTCHRGEAIPTIK